MKELKEARQIKSVNKQLKLDLAKSKYKIKKLNLSLIKSSTKLHEALALNKKSKRHCEETLVKINADWQKKLKIQDKLKGRKTNLEKQLQNCKNDYSSLKEDKNIVERKVSRQNTKIRNLNQTIKEEKYKNVNCLASVEGLLDQIDRLKVY